MNLLDFIRPGLTTVDFSTITTVKARTCRSFEDLISQYKKGMMVTKSLEDCVAICAATHIAVKLEGDPLWLYLVGAPSSGKSTICELLSADEYNTRPLSKFTGLVSGSRQGAHLVPMLHNKCVVVKDGTLLLESTPQQLANVYGELRDIFDGSLEAHYRNGVSASFSNISFGMIVGITERIYSLNMAALGERFLHCRLESTRDAEVKRNTSAIDAVLQNTERTVAVGGEEADSRSFPSQREYTAGFLNHLHSRIVNEDILRPQYTEYDKLFIQHLADVIACSRAQAPKDNHDKILYDSRPESSTRVVKQLSRLALCLCYVYDVKSLTPKIRSVLRKVSLDTAHGRQYYVIRLVVTAKSGITRNSLYNYSKIPSTSCQGIINDLISLKILFEEPEKNRFGPGRKNLLLYAPDWIVQAFKATSDETDTGVPQKKKPVYRHPKRSIRKVKKKSIRKR